MRPAEHLFHLAEAVTAFSGALGDGAAPVRHCPGWDVAGLVRHLGGVHRWATDSVLGDAFGDEDRPSPAGWPELVAWFDEGASRLLEVLSTTAPDTACPTFDRVPGQVRFWTRRQALETVVHRWDAQLAAGTPAPIDAGLAADGVDEVVSALLPRQLRLGRVRQSFAPVALVCDDVDVGRAVLTDDRSGATVATVTGPAERLLLLLWHRVPLSDPALRVTGERAAVIDALHLALTP